MNLHTLRILLISLLAAVGFSACIEDGFTTSPSDEPAFSTDVLDMGVVYTGEVTSTRSFKVFNPHGKGLNISRVALSGPNADIFRLNVDGFSGREFANVEIRAKDSIFVFVEATPPIHGQADPQASQAAVEFTVNGRQYSVGLTLQGQDITRIGALNVTTSARLTAERPYRVADSIVVASGATLTIEPGARVLMHDGAYIAVDGTLHADGTPQKPILITGDRTGEVIPDVSFDIMSRQWGGLWFGPQSVGNTLSYCEVSNTVDGVRVVGDGSSTLAAPMLTLRNCRLRNSGSSVLAAVDATVDARGCELAEAASGLVLLHGGDYRFDLCTVSNHYLFAAIQGAAWQFFGVGEKAEPSPAGLPTKARITNSITWGLGSDAWPGELDDSAVTFDRCLFKSKGEDDANFLQCLWDTDPLFYTVREDYIFDYRLKPDSPAINAVDPALSDVPLRDDYYGRARARELGAYAFDPTLADQGEE